MVEIIVTAINVFLLFFLIGYIVSDMAVGMLTKRKTRITDDIHTARLSRKEALEMKNDYEHRLETFESERAEILEHARQRAALAEERILLEGREEADRLIARANREAELKKMKLQDEVRHDMVLAASKTAGKLIAQNLDDAKQAVYIQEMLDEMGESTWQN
jgi:F-type H+-transporting ATPase subunit b